MARKRPPALDRIDIKILAALQRDGRMTVERLAGIAGLTPRPCLERVRRLEAAGIIAGYHAVVALESLSKPVTIFAEIVMDKQGREDRLEKRLSRIEERGRMLGGHRRSRLSRAFRLQRSRQYETLTTDLIDDATVGVARVVSHIALRPVRRFRRLSGFAARHADAARSEADAFSPNSRFCCARPDAQPISVVRRLAFQPHRRAGEGAILKGRGAFHDPF